MTIKITKTVESNMKMLSKVLKLLRVETQGWGRRGQPILVFTPDVEFHALREAELSVATSAAVDAFLRQVDTYLDNILMDFDGSIEDMVRVFNKLTFQYREPGERLPALAVHENGSDLKYDRLVIGWDITFKTKRVKHKDTEDKLSKALAEASVVAINSEKQEQVRQLQDSLFKRSNA